MLHSKALALGGEPRPPVPAQGAIVEIVDGSQRQVFGLGRNRLHAWKVLLCLLLGC
jgi:hypothetical protein